MADIFISYAREDDEPFVERLRDDLAANGLAVWWDQASMESRGRTFLQELRDAISGVDRLILVIGPRSAESAYVSFEWEFALAACRVVLPILRLGDYALVPKRLAKLHCPDFRVSRPYRDALAELLRIVRSQTPALGTLNGVDALPPKFLARPLELERLTAAVLADAARPTVITSTKQTVALEGMGGVGKSVLAAAFARDCETRRSFGDGIVWVRVGQHPGLVANLQVIGAALGDHDREYYADLSVAQSRLGAIMQEKTCLVVLDDVWDARHVEAVAGALGPRCRLLMTTRDSRIGIALGAQEHRLDVLNDAEALMLLADWADQQAVALPAEAREVVEECGNLPLALAMTGALVRGRPNRWGNALHRLRNADLAKIRMQFPNYAYPDLLRAIQVGVEALPANVRPRYLEFAIFPDDTLVPQAVLEMLWGPAGLDPYEIQDLTDLLVDRSMAQRSEDGRLSLHDLQLDYVRKQANDLPGIHGRLLDAYAGRCQDGWSSGPDDGYFFQHLVAHLVGANRQDQASKLLTDLDWMRAKLSATDVNALLADYLLIPADEKPRLIEDTLRNAAHVVSRDKGQLATQLCGRLLALDVPPARQMVERIMLTQRYPWLRPLTPTLSPPGGPLLRTVTGWAGHVEVLAITPDARLVVTGALHGIVKVWDLERDIELHDLKRFNNGITALALTPDGQRLVVGRGGGGLQLWDLSTGTEPFLLAGHGNTVVAVAVAADGRRAVSLAGYRWTNQQVGADVKVWDLSNGAELRGVAYSSDSRPLAVAAESVSILAAGRGNSVELWDFERSELRQVLGQHGSYIRAVAMAADGRVAISSEDDDLRWAGDEAAPMAHICALRVWDLERGVLRHLLTGHTRTVQSIALTADNRVAVSASDDHSVRVWDLVQGREHCTLAGHTGKVRAVAVTPNGRRIVSASDDHTIRVWDPWAAGAPQRQPAHGAPVTAVGLTSDCRRAVSAAKDGTLRTWDLTDGAALAAWTGSQYELTALAPMPDGRHILSGGRDGAVTLWDLDSQTPVHAFKLQMGSITALGVAPDGRLAACATENGRGAVCDLAGRRLLRSFQLRDAKLVMDDLIAFTTEGQLIGLGGHHSVEMWEVAGTSGLRSGAQRAGGQPGRHIRTLQGYPPLDGPGSFAVTPDGRRGVLAAGRYTVVWNFENGTKLHTVTNRTDYVSAVAVTPDGRRAVVAEDDNVLTLWDLDRGVQLHALVGHSDHIAILLATSHTPLAVSVSGDTLGILPNIVADRSLKLWDLQRGVMLASFNGESLITAAAITPDERTIVAGETSGRVHLLRIELPAAPKSAPRPPEPAQRQV